MYRIGKRYSFSAAHHLKGLPAGHKCARPHGHNYSVTVVLRGDLAQTGMLLDYAHIDEAIAPLLERVEHQDLNEVFKGTNPTAENLAKIFFDQLSKDPTIGVVLDVVRIQETSRTFAEYSPR